MQYYIVGGAVRDILLGLCPKDADVIFTGSTEDFLAKHPKAEIVGRSVHVFIVNGREYMPLQGASIMEDLQNRDLTINALAIDLHGNLFAHKKALQDLQKGILRPASPKAFAKDPLRIYRLARFAARFPHFALSKKALQQAQKITKKRHHIAIPAERIGRELRQALISAKPSRFFKTMQAIQALDPWFTELANNTTSYFNILDTKPKKLCEPAQWELLQYMLLCRKCSQEQALALGQRLCLPNKLCKAGVLMAATLDQALYFEDLSLGQQCELLLKIYKCGLSLPYWLALDVLLKKKYSPLRWQAEQCLRKVRLPKHLNNLGPASGKYLRQLQCNALQKFMTSAL